MNKGGTSSPDKTMALAEKMRGYGIVPEFSFVLGNPPDPEADAMATLEFVRRVKAANPAAEIILYMYTPVEVPGALYDAAIENGFRFPRDPGRMGERTGSGSPSAAAPECRGWVTLSGGESGTSSGCSTPATRP